MKMMTYHIFSLDTQAILLLCASFGLCILVVNSYKIELVLV